jgi:hypothetical protein
VVLSRPGATGVTAASTEGDDSYNCSLKKTTKAVSKLYVFGNERRKARGRQC